MAEKYKGRWQVSALLNEYTRETTVYRVSLYARNSVECLHAHACMHF